MCSCDHFTPNMGGDSGSYVAVGLKVRPRIRNGWIPKNPIGFRNIYSDIQYYIIPINNTILETNITYHTVLNWVFTVRLPTLLDQTRRFVPVRHYTGTGGRYTLTIIEMFVMRIYALQDNYSNNSPRPPHTPAPITAAASFMSISAGSRTTASLNVEEGSCEEAITGPC